MIDKKNIIIYIFYNYIAGDLSYADGNYIFLLMLYLIKYIDR